MKPKIIKTKEKKLKIKPNLVDYKKTYRRFDWQDAKKELGWFPGKKMNAAYSVIDRQAKGPRRNKVALYWQGKNGEKEKYTFAELSILSNKFANVLRNIGVKRGERLFSFYLEYQLYIGISLVL